MNEPQMEDNALLIISFRFDDMTEEGLKLRTREDSHVRRTWVCWGEAPDDSGNSYPDDERGEGEKLDVRTGDT